MYLVLEMEVELWELRRHFISDPKHHTTAAVGTVISVVIGGVHRPPGAQGEKKHYALDLNLLGPGSAVSLSSAMGPLLCICVRACRDTLCVLRLSGTSATLLERTWTGQIPNPRRST